MSQGLDNRRPLKSRDTGWARASAAALARTGVRPDMVSAGAVVFAAAGAGAFLASGLTSGAPRAACLLAAAAAIQLRLVCNLLDGMVAVEHGRGGPSGPIWNELPDRIADALFLVGAGYGAALAGAAWAEPLAWLAAALAILTAYVRELGRGLGQPADFSGPGAKPQRMAILTLAALATIAEPLLNRPGQILGAGLGLIALLAAVTVVRRTLHLAARLKAAAGA
ncbi:CDP-alcohol phosphatidyltransferase family protein [Phenylobacterium montanum]|uniref:CDP-alcohol phosphatidyltransferase family protein n=1 Tax=Phenylobacterium montanum TaxID=2823693 RepID=A0A975ITW9_9CAUL|nr:CDP-alcohol phosphatidyltransferase family protein [Caulobacter sp. S6]QUD86909.1 CDP-alcohol phosphatidyltransferase family protein [Caulobacter sp. S6]